MRADSLELWKDKENQTSLQNNNLGRNYFLSRNNEVYLGLGNLQETWLYPCFVKKLKFFSV
ncbi:MAG TPA: hypothetical protein VJ551_02700, partial [Nitrososphaeraceae archaeon]|nr:hypothetical protein [Nitrososphaeraceae archaeon]